METIEERAKAIAEKWKSDIIRGGEDLSFTHLEYVAKQAATEQDRIARQDERERCIKAAQEVHCLLCPIHNRCELIENGTIGVDTWNRCRCFDRVNIRKAIEEGGEG